MFNDIFEEGPAHTHTSCRDWGMFGRYCKTTTLRTKVRWNESELLSNSSRISISPMGLFFAKLQRYWLRDQGTIRIWQCEQLYSAWGSLSNECP
jgi:hypothetical protein